MNLRSIKKKTSDLIHYARNARTHSDEQVAQIAASIKEFGFTNPVIIDSENTILAVHGRIMAAQKTNRKCYGIELDPKYCDVIIKRWEDFTGQKATMNGKTFEELSVERNGK